MTTRRDPRIPQTLVKSQTQDVVRFFQDLVGKPNVGYDISDLTAIISNTAAAIADISDAELAELVTAPDALALPIVSTSFQGDGTSDAFNLPAGWEGITDKETLNIYVDGASQRSTFYTVTAGVLTFDEPPPAAASDNIFVKWIPDAVAVAVLANQIKARYNLAATALNAWVITVAMLSNALKVDSTANAQAANGQKTSFNDLLSNLRSSSAISGRR